MLKGNCRIPLVTTDHPALSSMIRVLQNLHPMLKSNEEHRKVFPEPPSIAFRRCNNLKDILVQLKLHSEGNGNCDSTGCSSCRMSRCQVCKCVCVVLKRLFPGLLITSIGLIFLFNFDLLNVVYLLEFSVCGLQYVGSTCTPFRVRFNNYKSCNRRFNWGASGVPFQQYIN